MLALGVSTYLSYYNNAPRDVIPNLQVRQLKPKEVISLAQGHKTGGCTEPRFAPGFI